MEGKTARTISKILKIIVVICLAYSAGTMYFFGFINTAGIIAISLFLFMIFNWLDALSRQEAIK